MSLGRIRIAHAGDLPQLTAIYNEAIADRFATADLHPVTVEHRAGWLAEHEPCEHPVFVIELDDEVVGYCSLSAYRRGRAALRRTAEISYYVARRARRQGAGRALVDHAVAAAPSLGLRVLFAIILARNEASVRFVERAGFTCWGRLPEVAEIEGQLIDHLYYGRRL
jgi:phosphinothricin acetyltransferase